MTQRGHCEGVPLKVATAVEARLCHMAYWLPQCGCYLGSST